VTTSLRWYVKRLRAMTTEEVLWRAGVRGRLVERRESAAYTGMPRWDDDAWRSVLERLVRTRAEAFLLDAERVAAGELDLWGQRVALSGAPDWRADPFDGTPWPAGSWRRWERDPKAVWELHRQQHLFALAAGAWVSGRQDWAAACKDQVLDWIARNPEGDGPGWTSAYEAAHRLVGWAWTVPLVMGAFTAGELERVSRSYTEQARFVAARPSRYSSANNHRLAELTGLLAASLLGVGEDRWDALWGELEDEVVRQTYGDGGSREQAAGYFLYVLEILWVAGVLARAAARPLGRIEERLTAMLAWLAVTGGDDGEPPAVGDDAEDRLLRVEYFAARRADAIAGRVDALLQGDLTLVPRPRLRTEASDVLAESGYAILRSRARGEPVRLVLDVGDLGFGTLAAHGHADALSLLLDLGTRPLLRDSGTGSYAPSEGRDEFRETVAHNTVVVNGESQAEPLGPHMWGRRFRTVIHASTLAPTLDYVRASHEGYRALRADAVHTRSVTYVKPLLIVVADRVESRRVARATLVWQLWPGDLPGRLAGGAAALAVAAEPEARWGRSIGRFSQRYSAQQRAPRFTWTAEGTDIVFVTVVSLGGPDARMPKLRVLREGEAAAVEIAEPRRLRLVERWTGNTSEVEA
jgi:Heparinase II/III-like protein/Heparinase II/III N-terminus